MAPAPFRCGSGCTSGLQLGRLLPISAPAPVARRSERPARPPPGLRLQQGRVQTQETLRTAETACNFFFFKPSILQEVQRAKGKAEGGWLASTQRKLARASSSLLAAPGRARDGFVGPAAWERAGCRFPEVT